MKIGPPSFERHSCSYPYQSLQQSENKWCAESLVLSGDGEVQVSPMWANGGSAPRPFTQNMSCLVLLSTVYSLIKPSLLLWMPSPQSTLCIENWEDSRYYHHWNKVKILWEPWRAKQLFSAFPWYVLQHEAGAGHQAARGEVLPHLRPLQPIEVRWCIYQPIRGQYWGHMSRINRWKEGFSPTVFWPLHHHITALSVPNIYLSRSLQENF